MNMFSQRMSGMVGPAYVVAFFGGGITGIVMPPEQKGMRQRKLRLTNYVDNCSKTASRYANNTAAAVFLFIMTGKFLQFLLQEEIEDLNISVPVRNAMFGGFTGALYKSTRGRRPMMFGAFLGATVGSTYAHLYTNGYLSLPL